MNMQIKELITNILGPVMTEKMGCNLRSVGCNSRTGSFAITSKAGLIPLLIIVTLFLFASVVQAQTYYYVRAGATGANNGSDWHNAYTNFPSSLVRGATYYVADGSYGSYTFKDPVSGSKVITIKKATTSDHGSSTGWQNSYGDGQAVFGQLSFSTSYYAVNGQTRNESNWRDTSSYGFRGNSAVGGTAITINENASNLTFKYIDIGSNYGAVWPDVLTFAVKMTLHGSLWNENIYFGFMHIHNVLAPFHSRGKNNVTIEHSYIGPSFGKEAISHQRGHNWIIRWNKWLDNCADPQEESGTATIGVFNYTGGGDPADTLSDGWEIYGNIIGGTGTYSLGHADALIVGNTVNNWKFWNNTISRTDGNWGGTITLDGTGNSIKNNLWYWMGDYDATTGSIVQAPGADYSWCYYKNPNPAKVGRDCSNLPGKAYDGKEDPFVDESNGNYRLKLPGKFSTVSPIDKGVSLGGYPYNVDIEGNTRGADGYWDIGAFEFVDSSDAAPSEPTTPMSPENLHIVQ